MGIGFMVSPTMWVHVMPFLLGYRQFGMVSSWRGIEVVKIFFWKWMLRKFTILLLLSKGRHELFLILASYARGSSIEIGMSQCIISTVKLVTWWMDWLLLD